jgi:hypothetical protein
VVTHRSTRPEGAGLRPAPASGAPFTGMRIIHQDRSWWNGLRWWTRTTGLRVRNPTLYPAELSEERAGTEAPAGWSLLLGYA